MLMDSDLDQGRPIRMEDHLHIGKFRKSPEIPVAMICTGNPYAIGIAVIVLFPDMGIFFFPVESFHPFPETFLHRCFSQIRTSHRICIIDQLYKVKPILK